MSEILEYIDGIDANRRQYFINFLDTIRNNIPDGFQEEFSYKMIGFVVPKSIYFAGYHCNSKLPLPFVTIGAQKNAFVLHHLALYADPVLKKWFEDEYPKFCNHKLDMGKGCVRFKKIEYIPLDLITELIKKVSVNDWISTYEKNIKTK